MQGMQTFDQDDQLSQVEPLINHVGEEPDGSLIYEIDYAGEPETAPPMLEKDFYANLAESLDPNHLNSIADSLIEEIDDDKSSRDEWEQTTTKAMEYLGFKVEEFIKSPFVDACGAYDTTLATALINFYADARAELFPAKGPAKLELLGDSDPQREAEGKIVIDFINDYLTRKDKGYYPDSERLLMYVGLLGSAFRKTYTDPILGKPRSRLVLPYDFIIDNNAVSVLSSQRMTQIVQFSRSDIIKLERNNIFLKCDLPETNDDDAETSPIENQIDKMQGVDKDAAENKNIFKFYECYNSMRIKGIDDDLDPELPLPYCVTICITTRKIVSIRRNWVENDPDYERREYFTQYNYLPGFGIYGIGQVHLCCSGSVVLTAIERALVNAGLLNNHPGGVMKKGLVKADQNNIAVGLGEFKAIDTGEQDIRQVMMQMPYNPPSVVLKEIASEIRQNILNLIGASMKSVSDAINPNTGQVLGLALIDMQSRVQSSVLRSLHMSLGHELQLLFKCFSEDFNEEQHVFDMPGKTNVIQKSYFNQNVGIIPVSDPDLITNTQRLMRMDAVSHLVEKYPQLYNLRAFNELMLKTINFKEIDQVLLPETQPIPQDPVTENANLLQGKPVKAFPEQDHDAHIMVHSDPLMQSNPQISPAVAAHNQEHVALKYLVEMQAQIGIMPNPQQLAQNPDLQQQIAVAAAKVTMEKIKAMQEQQQQQQPPSPTEVVMMEINQKREAAQLKYEEAKLRAETDAYKATINSETEKMKLKAQQEMAEEKNDVTLDVAEMRKSTPRGQNLRKEET